MSIRALREADQSERVLPIFALSAAIGLLAVLRIWLPLAKNSKKAWILALGSLPGILLLIGAFIRANPCIFSGC